MMNFTWPQWLPPRDNWIWDAVARRWYFLEPATNRVRYEDGSYSQSSHPPFARASGHEAEAIETLSTPSTYRNDRYHQHRPDATNTFAGSAGQDSNYLHDSHTRASLNASTPRFPPGEAVLDTHRHQALAASPQHDHPPSSYSPTLRNGAFGQHSPGQMSPPAFSAVQTSNYTYHDPQAAVVQTTVDNATPRHFEQRPRGLAMPPLPEHRTAGPMEYDVDQRPAPDSSPPDSMDIELDQASQSESPPRSLKEEKSAASGDRISNSPAAADVSLSAAPTVKGKRRDSHHAVSEPHKDELKKAKEPKNFFKVGKVFYARLPDLFDHKGKPLDPKYDDSRSTSTRSGSLTQISPGEWVFAKTRPWVVVREGPLSCQAVPVNSYGHRATGKWGIKASDHAIIYSGRVAAEPLPEEGLMQPFAIRVDADRNDEKLDPLSRVDFGRPQTIQHYAKVKSFGMVNSDSVANLVSQWRNVNLEDTRHASPEKVAERRPGGTTSSSSSSQYHRAYNDLVKMGWIHDDVIKFLEPTRNAAISKTKGRRHRASTARENADVAARGDGPATEDGHAMANGDDHHSAGS